MSILMKVTGKTLAKNRTRTLVTIIGIILSTAMLTAVASIVSSFMAFYRTQVAQNTGEWYIASYEVSAYDEDRLRQDARTKTVYAGYELGYAEFANYNPNKPYLFLLGADTEFMQHMGVNLVEGRLPENENEILLPAHLVYNMEKRPHLGDVLTIEPGRRTLGGENCWQHTPYFTDEDYNEMPDLLPEIGKETFVPDGTTLSLTVTGVYERPDWEEYSSPGYTALVWRENAEESVPRMLFFTTKNPRDALTWTMENWDYAQEGNTELLMAEGVSSHNSFYSVLYGMAAILIILILFGSISLIYNAFSISVSDRTRQFGLLSSVGATRRQLRHAVFCEALIVGGIGVPLGILAGLGGISVTLGIIGQKLAPLFDRAYSGISIRMQVNAMTIAVSAALGFGTVLISAWIPAIRATRIPPIEAIRSNKDIRDGGKNVRVGAITRRLFGLSGVLSRKYYARDKKRYKSTILSIIMSIVLFVAASSLVGYLTGSISSLVRERGFEYSYLLSEDVQENDTMFFDLFREMESLEGVKEGAWAKYFSGYMKHADSVVSKEAKEHLGQYIFENELSVLMLFVDDDTFREYLKDCGEDPSRYFVQDEPLAVLAGSSMRMEGDVLTTRYYFDKAPEEVTVSLYFPFLEEEDYQSETLFTVNVGSAQKEVPRMMRGYLQEIAFILLPKAQYEAVLQKYSPQDGTILMFFNSDGSREVSESMPKLLADHELSTGALIDVRAEEQGARNIVFVIRLLAGGFITLITLIAVANVFNTIFTNIRLRRRDFAMLRSVGMTHRDVIRMMMDECLIYGTRALLLGIPLSLLFSFAMYQVMSSGISTSFILPWQALLISAASVFLIVFASMMFAWKELRKENLVEAIRSDIQ